MSCNCHTNPPLPLISDDTATSPGLEVCCDDPALVSSTPGEGTTLDNSWLDTVCQTSGVTLFGRVGNKLARLVGTGFLAITNGAVSVVTSVPLSVRTLWHRWWKTTPNATPIVGVPLPFPYMVIADSQGGLHAIKGAVDVVSVPVWNGTEYVQTPASELPHAAKGVLTQGTGIELVGYAPVADKCAATERNERGLAGAGLVWLEEVTLENEACGCSGVNDTVSVARTFALPPSDGHTYKLTYTNGELLWVHDL